jgi:hypothetical protein
MSQKDKQTPYQHCRLVLFSSVGRSRLYVPTASYWKMLPLHAMSALALPQVFFVRRYASTLLVG